MLARATDPLVRAVSRSRATVHTKLLVAFVGIVALLVVVMVLGLRVLGDSNARVDELGTLQLKSVVYQELQTNAEQVRRLLALCAGGSAAQCYSGCPSLAPGQGASPSPAPGTRPGSMLAIDQNIASALGRLIPATNESLLGFEPSTNERRQIAQIREQGSQLAEVIQQITDYDMADAADKGLTLQSQKAEPLSKSIEALALGLVDSTLSQTQSLKADNASAFDQSQALF